MKLSVPMFKGEAPRISPRILPDEHAQEAINCRLLSGDLEGWRNFRTESALCKGANVNTIYLMSGTSHWLHWTDSELAAGAVEVDVAKSSIAGDPTGRVYLTGLDVPRWTNVADATTGGSGCFPQVTHPLGVPGPTAAPIITTTVDPDAPTAIVIDDDCSSFSAWQTTPDTSVSQITADGAFGNPAGSFRMRVNTSGSAGDRGNLPARITRDLGTQGANVLTIETDFYFDAALSDLYLLVQNTDSGSGPAIGIDQDPTQSRLNVYQQTTFAAAGSQVLSFLLTQDEAGTIPRSLATGQWYRVKIEMARQNNSNLYNFTCTVWQGATQISQTIRFSAVGPGSLFGYSVVQHATPFPDPNQTHVDNLSVRGSVPANVTDDLATSYVYTYVNDIGEESAPSPASDTLMRDDGTEVVITIPAPAVSPTFNVVKWRLYRAVTGSQGTSFFFVAEIDLPALTYTDTKTDSQLGEELESSNWDMPPAGLRGILALPNDIYVGFFENVLCFSVQGRPHAWPVEWRLATDQPIVAIGNIDTTVVIGTKAFPYLAAGNSPDAYSMSKLEINQGCVSKRSLAYLKGIGVVYATPDGLLAIAGTGQAQIVTEQLFTREQWQALPPESLIAESHDDRYMAFYGSTQGMLLELKQGGFGKVTLGFHARAAYTDAARDALFLVLDANVVPGGMTGQVTPNGQTIYEFDPATPNVGLTPRLPFSWRSKQWQQPQPDYPQFGMVRARDAAYGATSIAFKADASNYYARPVSAPDAFRLPRLDEPMNRYEITISGGGQGERISGAQVTDDVMEFDL